MGGVTIRHLQTHWSIDGDGGEATGAFGEIRVDPRHHRDAKRFWNKCAFNMPCSAGVVAFDRGDVVAFCRYFKSRNVMAPGFHISMQGTWVHPSYRKNGMSVALWSKVLKDLPPTSEVDGVTASRGGIRMVSRLKVLFPHFSWTVD